MKRISKQQDGIVSILVAMIIMTLISLIALGFAFLVRQNQRASLNRQLSTQAFYAAESGVNDVVKNIDSIGSNITNCNDSFPGKNPQLDGNNVAYTCVLVNKQPDTLVYDSISATSTIAHITASSSVASLEVAWQDAGQSPRTGFAAATGGFKFPQVGTYSGSKYCPSGCNAQTADVPNNVGVLRTTIIPASASTNTDALLSSSQTVFMYPKATSGGTGGGTVSKTGGDGIFGDGRCTTSNTPRQCKVTITGVNLSDFFVRLKAIYRPVAVTVTAYDGAGSKVPISGAQAIVDSTGRAQDVVRRIQVRVPLQTGYYFPENAIETTGSLCKRLVTWPGGAEAIGGDAAKLYDGSNPPNNRNADEAACEIPES